MTKISLRDDQYRNGDNLNARIAIHALFSTNPLNWFCWIFDHIKVPAQASILELGCGQGNFWRENIDRLPDGWLVTLSDLSPGMLEGTRAILAESGFPFRFEIINAEEIPLADASLDVVIANHMIYHIPDRNKGIAEMRRVLKPGGRLYAATNGENHMRELHELSFQAGIDMRTMRQALGPFNFNMENGGEQLRTYFDHVELIPYEDGLRITDAEVVLNYALSMGSFSVNPITEEQLEHLRSLVQAEINTRGAFYVQKTTGLFIAS